MCADFCDWEETDDASFSEEPESFQEPLKRGSYIMYHGTTVASARLIINNGFRQSIDGFLGRGVYFSRDMRKATRYPINVGDFDRVVLEVRVRPGRVKKIDTDNHPLRRSWHEHGYDSAWVPPNCGMRSMPSGLEDICVFDPKRMEVVGIAKAPNAMILRDLRLQSEASRKPRRAIRVFTDVD